MESFRFNYRFQLEKRYTTSVANICLNLFNLTGPGNYSLRHYVIIAQFSLVHTYYVTWRQNPFVFHSDFRYQQVSSQIYFPSLPVPNTMTFGLAVLTYFFPITCWWVGGSRSGICCQLPLTHVALWMQVSDLIHSHPKKCLCLCYV